MSAFRPVSIAVVGLGYWGPNLVRVLAELPEANLLAACDVNRERALRIKRRHPAVSTERSFEDILRDDSIEAIAIATSVSTHFPLAMAALEAGKHVFVEKPMASSVNEAEELMATASERGLVLMPGHTFLYSPPVDLVRTLIQSGELGDVYFVTSSRVNLGLHQSDASVIWDLGPHDFSILRYWLDESPSTVAATARGCVIPDVPDVAFVSLEYESGALAHVELSWLAPSKLRRTAVVGSRKMVVYDDTSSEPVRVFDSGVDLPDPLDFGQYRLSYRTGDIVSPAVPASEPLSLEMSDWCRSIREGRVPRSSAALGVEVVRVIEAAEIALGMSDRVPTA